MNWAPDGKHFLFVRSGAYYLFSVEDRREMKLVDIAELRRKARRPPPSRVSGWTNRHVRQQSAQWAGGGKLLLLLVEGDVFLYRTATRSVQQLTATPWAEQDAKISPDGKRVAWVQANDLYTLDIASGKIARLTANGSATLQNGWPDWVYPEELDVSTAYWWSPDSRSIAYLQFDVSREAVYPHVDLTGLEAIYEPQRYPRAGTPNAAVRLGVAPAAGGRTVWMDLGDPTQGLLARVAWTPDSASLFVQRLNRVQNRLDLVRAEAASGKTSVLFTERDSAWVNVADDLRFLSGGKQFLWSSERDGFRHLYLYAEDGILRRRLTEGSWEVTDVGCVDEPGRAVYYQSTEPSPLERAIYRVSLDGGPRQQITTREGTNAAEFGRGCGYYHLRQSSLRSPVGEWIEGTRGHTEIVWREPRSRDAEEYRVVPTEIVKVPAADGETMYARLTKPADFKSGIRYPAIVVVYGGPHVQTVLDAYRKPRSWEQVMAQRGFVIWQLDNRGSFGRGHKWEAVLHGRLGKTELEDQLTGLDYLLSLGFVDPKRVGIEGWSYGGYMTLYALLNAPGRFAAGVAGAPVTDWRLYDTIYTERYLGLPQDNEDGYRASSVVNQAARLEAKLLLIHNYNDDNVLYQNTVRMADALTQAGKQFRLLAYPENTHGVTGKAQMNVDRAMTDFFEEALKPQ